MKKAIMAAITVVVLIVLFYVVYALIGKICAVNLGAEVKLPLVAIAGVILLLLVLAVVSVAFGVSGLSDKTQALALPEGSVRAVIALALVVLFATLSVFLFESMATGSPRTAPNLTEAQKKDFLQNNKTATDIVVAETGEGTAKIYTIDYRDPINKQSEDLAKQLLTMLGTLLTAMASFYFGTRAVSSTTQAGNSMKVTPHLRNVDPPSHSRAKGVLNDLQVLGDNLNSIKQVKIVNQGKQILATEVVSNDSVVKCNIPVDATTPTGKWDVVAIDSTSQSASLPSALEIT